MWQVTRDWLLSKGLDVKKDTLEISCYAHAINGGLKIDENAMTSVDNLYAAGEVAAGPHGADRLGGNMLVTCQVFGAIAGANAAKSAKEKQLRISDSLLTDEQDSIKKRLANAGKYTVNDIKRRLKEQMWKNMLVIRSKQKLGDCIESIQELKQKAASANVKQKQELFSLFEMNNMLDTAQIMTKAALIREESRGSHFREDFPLQNDSQWNKLITIKKQDST